MTFDILILFVELLINVYWELLTTKFTKRSVKVFLTFHAPTRFSYHIKCVSCSHWKSKKTAYNPDENYDNSGCFLALLLRKWLHNSLISVHTNCNKRPYWCINLDKHSYICRCSFLVSSKKPIYHLEMFYLNSTFFGIPPVLVFQLEVYYKVDRLLTGLTTQLKGTTALWYSNKTSLQPLLMNYFFGGGDFVFNNNKI